MCILSLGRAIASVCVTGVIDIMVDDDQRVDDCGRSCITGIHYVPYDTCYSLHNQHAVFEMITFSPTTEW